METIGSKITKLRKEKHVSQEQLAAQLGVSRQTVFNWESGRLQPKAENFQALCTYFQVEINYFLPQEAKGATQGQVKELADEVAALRQQVAAQQEAFSHPQAAADVQTAETDAAANKPKLTKKTLAGVAILSVVMALVVFTAVVVIGLLYVEPAGDTTLHIIDFNISYRDIIIFVSVVGALIVCACIAGIVYLLRKRR